MTTDDHSGASVADVSVRPIESDEYERVVIATADVDGPDGATSVRRRYEALPRHNDVVDRDAIDVNDRLVERPDAVHVHTKWYANASGATAEGDYVRDAHDTWRPDDPTVLADESSFRAATREHLLATVGDAPAEAREEGSEDH